MESHPKWRLRMRAALENYFQKHSFPRLALSLIVILSGLAGFIISYALLHYGVEAMSVRYPFAVIGAYVIFLMLLRLWVEIERIRYDPKRVAISDTPAGENKASPLNENKDPSSWLDWLDVIEIPDASDGCVIGCLLVFLFGLLAGAAGFLFAFVMAAPQLLAEVFLDAVAVSLFYRHLKTAAMEHWLGTAVKRTWITAMLTAAGFCLAGYLLDELAPGSQSFAPAIKEILSL